MFDDALLRAAGDLLKKAKEKNVFLCAAESCTGGLIAGVITEIPGSSDVFLGGWVTYGNATKQHFLGVAGELLKNHGAVSEQVARTMSEGALRAMKPSLSGKQKLLSIAVTGIAGPGGGTPEKPVGTVHLAASDGKTTLHRKCLFHGSRQDIRWAAVKEALAMLSKLF